MRYDILKDPLFYGFLLIFISAAVILINSVKKLTAIDFKEYDDDLKEDELLSDSPKIEENQEKNKDIVIDERNGEVDIKTQKEEIEKIEFDDEEENLFKSQKEDLEEKEQKKDEKNLAEEFILALNRNLEDIKKHLPPDDLLKRIERIEEKMAEIDKKITEYSTNDIMTKLSEIEKNIEGLSHVQPDAYGRSEKTTPKYIYKYVEDIVEDYENIDKEMIKKRLKIILNELHNTIARNGD